MMSATLWLSSEPEVTLDLGPTLPFYTAFAEMAKVAGPSHLADWPDLFGVPTAVENQQDAPVEWLHSVREDATELLDLHGSQLSPHTHWLLTQLKASPAAEPAVNYDPEEPREPAGSSEGGQWTSAGGTSAGGSGGKDRGPRPESITRKKGESYTSYRARYDAARAAYAGRKLTTTERKQLTARYVELHNAAARELAKAFRDVGAAMWPMDRSHPIKEADTKDVLADVRSQEVSGVLPVVRPLTILDKYPQVRNDPKLMRQLNQAIDGILAKYTRQWRKDVRSTLSS